VIVISGEDVALITQFLTNSGKTAEEIGVELTKILKDTLHAGPAAKEAMGKLGVLRGSENAEA